MSLLEPVSAATASRGGTSLQTNNTARSGTAKAQSVQSAVTAKAAAPIQTTQAVVQAQAAEVTRMAVSTPPKVTRVQPQLVTPPITAVLLHEMRLQQELSAVHEKLAQSSG